MSIQPHALKRFSLSTFYGLQATAGSSAYARCTHSCHEVSTGCHAGFKVAGTAAVLGSDVSGFTGGTLTQKERIEEAGRTLFQLPKPPETKQ